LSTAEGALHVGHVLVHAHGVFRTQHLARDRSAQHVDPVERGLGRDRLRFALVAEGSLRDRDREVLGHLEASEHLAHTQTDPVLSAQRALLPPSGGGHRLELALGRLEQRFALARALGREQGILAHDQALAREVGMGDLRQIGLVEQRRLQRTLGELADRLAAQRADPVESFDRR